MTFQKRKSPFPFVEEGITPNDHPPSCVFLCAHMDMSMDIHMDTSMDIHMEMPIKSKVSELDAYKAAHDGLTPFEVARRSHDSQAMPDDRMEPGIEPTLF